MEAIERVKKYRDQIDREVKISLLAPTGYELELAQLRDDLDVMLSEVRRCLSPTMK